MFRALHSSQSWRLILLSGLIGGAVTLAVVVGLVTTVEHTMLRQLKEERRLLQLERMMTLLAKSTPEVLPCARLQAPPGVCTAPNASVSQPQPQPPCTPITNPYFDWRKNIRIPCKSGLPSRDQNLVACPARRGLPCECAFGVVTPVFSGHFAMLVRYANTVMDRVVDNFYVPWLIVVSDDTEKSDLAKEIAFLDGQVPYAIFTINELAEASGVPKDQAAAINASNYEYKTPYQALKKLYGLRFLNCSYMLITDSETQMVKKMSLVDAFDDYFARPFVVMADVEKIRDEPTEMQRRNESIAVIGVHQLQQKTLPQFVWNFEYYGWFVERDSFTAMWNHIEKFNKRRMDQVFARHQMMYEMMPYWWYIYFRRGDYPWWEFPYNFEMMQPYTPSLDLIQAKVQDVHRGARLTVWEHICQSLNDETYVLYYRAMQAWKIRMFKAYPGFCKYIVRIMQEQPQMTMLVSSDGMVQIDQNKSTVSCLTQYIIDHKLAFT
eukprot:TRINITY_DN3058_c0_g1_i2.p1 TRINITY_DN3058_c0_g1~~TRINITY_DN3058_c0_g1_i2.p1  ORF type:complete len:493 (+),score=103.64 TRINITY_DN3058_c0_g1_i2:881-2359(+)